MAEPIPPKNPEDIIKEVVDNVQRFESNTSEFLTDRDLFWDMYRGVPKLAQNRERTEGLANLAIPTTGEAVDTLANTLYSMLTASDPNFEINALRGDIPEQNLFKISHLLKYQQEKIKYKKKLMVALRSTVLNGHVFVEQPWVSWPPGPTPIWEACDFIVRPLIQMFWSPSAAQLEFSDYIGTLDIVTPSRIRALASMDFEGSTWIPGNIELGIAEGHNLEFVPQEVRTRLETLGYKDFKNNMELIIQYGPLESEGIKEDMVVGVLNRKHLVRYHPSPYPYGFRPYRLANYKETENQPLGMGVGHEMKEIQKWINSNMNRVMDVITFSLFNMHFISRLSGFKVRDARPRPWSFIEVDDVNGVQPVRPNERSAEFGIKLHEILVELARNRTGATPTLQAVITDASASEVRIAQNNSLRSVSNTAEILGETLIREVQLFQHYNNMRFLDHPIWMRVSGIQNPVSIFPSDIQADIDIGMKIVTDKDFTPKGLQNDIELLKVLTSIRSVLPGVDPGPIILDTIQSIVRKLGRDPSKISLQQQQPSSLPSITQGANPQVAAGLLNKERVMAEPMTNPTEVLNVLRGQLNGNLGGV